MYERDLWVFCLAGYTGAAVNPSVRVALKTIKAAEYRPNEP